MQINYALTNQTGGVPPGPAVPPAVTESECSSAGLAQVPAAASSEATQDVLTSPLSPKRVHSDSAGASDGGKALSSPVVSIKVRRSFRSKKTTTSPGEYSCGACPVFISDFSSYGMLRHEQDHQHQATTEARKESGNWR